MIWWYNSVSTSTLTYPSFCDVMIEIELVIGYIFWDTSRQPNASPKITFWILLANNLYNRAIFHCYIKSLEAIVLRSGEYIHNTMNIYN